jgi:hypothetical protein
VAPELVAEVLSTRPPPLALPLFLWVARQKVPGVPRACERGERERERGGGRERERERRKGEKRGKRG